MREGRLLQVGTPFEVHETPANRFVADFIGHVNLMDGTLVEDEADHVLIRCADCTHHVGHGITGALGMLPPAARTQLKMLVTWQPNSLANSLGLRSERTSSTICSRNDAEYGCLGLDIFWTLSLGWKVSAKGGNFTLRKAFNPLAVGRDVL
jgi:ABC-type proline/glycine betaine transport system ATPase subunit